MRIFNCKRVADIGKFLGLKNPYHGARLIFESKKPNAYLCKLVEIKKEANARIETLSQLHKQHNDFKAHIHTTLNKVEHSLNSVQSVKEIYHK